MLNRIKQARGIINSKADTPSTTICLTRSSSVLITARMPFTKANLLIITASARKTMMIVGAQDYPAKTADDVMKINTQNNRLCGFPHRQLLLAVKSAIHRFIL